MDEKENIFPNWALKKLEALRDLEIRSGNLVDDQTVAGFHSQLTDRLTSAVASSADDSILAESIFGEICRGLVSEGFSVDQVVRFINSRLKSNGKLPYCDASEVQSSLSTPRR